MSPEYVSWRFQSPTTQLIVQAYVNGLVQERLNSSALAMELRLSCINPSIYWQQDSIEALNYWFVVRGIRWWPVDSPHKGPVMHEEFPCHDVNMGGTHWVDDLKSFGMDVMTLGGPTPSYQVMDAPDRLWILETDISIAWMVLLEYSMSYLILSIMRHISLSIKKNHYCNHLWCYIFFLSVIDMIIIYSLARNLVISFRNSTHCGFKIPYSNYNQMIPEWNLKKITVK